MGTQLILGAADRKPVRFGPCHSPDQVQRAFAPLAKIAPSIEKALRSNRQAMVAGMWAQGSIERTVPESALHPLGLVTVTITWWLPAEIHELGSYMEARRVDERVTAVWEVNPSTGRTRWQHGTFWRSKHRVVNDRSLSRSKQIATYAELAGLFGWFGEERAAQQRAMRAYVEAMDRSA